MIDTGPGAVIYGVVNYPGLAKVQLSTGRINSFAAGRVLPAPKVEVLDGVSFYIGSLSRSACSYHFLEVNTTSASYSAEHNIGFGGDGAGQGYRITNDPGNDGRCEAGRLDPLSYSEGVWQLPPGRFSTGNPSGSGPGGGSFSTCTPPTSAATSGRPASTLTTTAVLVASGTVGGQPWSLWSKKGEAGVAGLEDGGIVLDHKAYGLCAGFPNPAELEMFNPGAGKKGIVYGVSGYRGPARITVSVGTLNSFLAGRQLLSQHGQLAGGTTFFIGQLPATACRYRSLELNVKAAEGSSQHNLGFGTCAPGKLVQINGSMGAWSGP